MKHKEITEKIIGAAYEVHKFLGMDFMKSFTKEHYHMSFGKRA